MIPWILLTLFQWWWAIAISAIAIWLFKVVLQRLGGSHSSRVHIVPVAQRNIPWKLLGKLTIATLFLPLALWLLAGVITYMAWATPRAVNAVSESINGPQLHTGIEQGDNNATPPHTKTVGGPLRWSDDAKVKLRNRVSRENVGSNGAAFVGVIPPTSWMDTTFVAYSEGSTSWKAFLIDYTSMGNFPSPRLLNNRAASGENVRNVAMVHLPKLSHGREEKRIENTLPQSETRVTECYIQLDGGPTAIHLDIREPSGTFQYVVEVGAEGTSFTPPQSFKWLWVAAVHHPKYQASLDGQPVPAEGSSIAGYNNLFGTMATVNGETKVLDTPLLFQAGEVTSQIDLFLNVPKDALDKIGTLKPARVIVGIQL